MYRCSLVKQIQTLNQISSSPILNRHPSTMTVITRQQARQAKAVTEDPLRVANNLNNMPAEIIDIIVQHLRAIAAQQPIVVRKWEPCQCVAPLAPKSTKQKKELSSVPSADPCLALSCVSKWLRNVVFNNRINRSISTSYCDWGVKQSQAASEVMRNNVR